MARLIDANALPDALFQKHVHYSEGTEMYLSYNDVVDTIDDAPTIDAIPVEWLKTQLTDESYDELIFRWQKEQEAR